MTASCELFDTSYLARLYLENAGWVQKIYSNDARLLASASHLGLIGVNIL